MTKTATITCEFEYELRIGRLTPQDAELTSKMLGHGFIPTIDFYRVAEIFHGEVLPESELDHLAKLVKDFLYGKLQTSLPRHFASNGKARIADKRGADDCWYSELDRYLNSTRFCGLEIEYR